MNYVSQRMLSWRFLDCKQERAIMPSVNKFKQFINQQLSTRTQSQSEK